jgi:hypothetical protein
MMDPHVSLRQLSATQAGAMGFWNVCWQVENLGAEGLRINSVRMPHGQFKLDEQSFAPGLDLAPGGSAQFHSLVQCHEPAGLVTENAFVIFHCQWRDEAWRIFIRIRVVVMADGAPETAVELITTQKVGFSGISN